MKLHMGLLDAEPSWRREVDRSRGLSLALLLSLVGLMALGASYAGAVKVPIPEKQICSAGTQGGQCNGVRGIAVNTSGNGGVAAGTIYAADNGNFRIQSFDSDGKFLRAWGWDVIAVGKPNDGGAGFEICDIAAGNVGADCKNGAVGSGAGQFTTNSATGGVAVNQVTGDVYVIDRTSNRVQQFDATGHFIRTWGADVDSTGGTGFEICEVAVNCKAGIAGTAPGMFGASTAIAGIGTDSAGNVYVADPANKRVQKFSSTGGFLRMAGWDVVETGPGDDTIVPEDEFEICIPADGDVCKAGLGGTGAGQFGTSNLPSFLATSPAGDVYVVARTDGTIYHLTSTLAFDAGFAPAAVASGNNNRNAVAVNPADGHLFFARFGDTNIHELDPVTQEVVAKHPTGATEWVGLSVDPLVDRLYAARTLTASSIIVLEEGPPIVTATAATENTGTRATLNGTVNPNGNAVDQCFFEWGTTTAYGQTAPCVPDAAGIGSGTGAVAVHADIAGLVPNGSAYHYRLVAGNPKGTAKSADRSFVTPDTVVTLAPTAVTDTAATLNGTVNPDGGTIGECLFEYGATIAYGETAPCVPAAGGITGTSPVAVHADVDDLAPGSVYHVRLKTAYATGPVHGKDVSFQTAGAVIQATWAENVSDTEALLKAAIDPEGLATTYRFEYGTTEAYGQQTTELTVGSDSTVHEVASHLDGLEPGTSYHYRVVATNSAAVNKGPDRVLITYPAPTDPNSDCSNQEFRTGSSAHLSNCRAYEMVSPVDKNGGDIETLLSPLHSNEVPQAHDQSAIDGDGLTYSSKTSFGDAVGAPYSSQYLARRDPQNGWLTHSISPLREGFAGLERQALEVEFKLFSDDLSQGWLVHDADPPLAGCSPVDSVNLYRRFNDTDTYEELNCVRLEPKLGRNLIELQGVSGDGCRAVFRSKGKLTPDANEPAVGLDPPYQLYEHDCEGNLRLVGVLPGGDVCKADSSAGSNVEGSFHNHLSKSVRGALSIDARRLYWSCGNTLYLRVDSNPAVDGDENVVPVAAGAMFQGASPDGSTALLTSGGILFSYDAGSETATEIAAGVIGSSVLGVNEDASRAYFVSTQALAGAGANSEGDEALAGQSNLYLYEQGESGPRFSFVGTLSHPADLLSNANTPSPFHPFRFRRASRVSPDGLRLAFISTTSLTGYDNSDVQNGEPAAEVFLYDATANGGDGELVCVSCNPSRARPRAGDIADGISAILLGAADIPGWLNQFYASRALSDDGSRLFFESFDSLVLRDTNGRRDVYEWERAASEAECDALGAELFVADASGCISLISSGQGPEGAGFVDADPDGSNVFIRTGESLLVQDPGLIDIYDARVGGGFEPPPPPPPGCQGEACQVPPPPPAFQAPSSSAYSGPGDPAGLRNARPRCPKGKRRVARRGKPRCVKASSHRGKRRATNRRRRAGR